MGIVVATVLLAASAGSRAKSPDCASPGRWPASMAFVYLKNTGVTDNAKVDFAKTTVIRLASEPKGNRLFRQIHLIAFVEKSGRRIEVITSNDASIDECSESDVDVYVVSQRSTRK